MKLFCVSQLEFSLFVVFCTPSWDCFNCVYKFYLNLNTLAFTHCYKFSWSCINIMPYIIITAVKKSLTTLKEILVLHRSKLFPFQSLGNHIIDQFTHFLCSFDFFRMLWNGLNASSLFQAGFISLNITHSSVIYIWINDYGLLF